MRSTFWICLAITIVQLLVCDNPFFWDTVQLASKQAHFFYETGFRSIILPNEIDSGHPPLFGLYLALLWQLFGKTLWLSHLAVLPFLYAIVYFLVEIGKKLLGLKNAVWLPLLCFSDPVLASQSLLVSPDIVLVCAFLAAIWAIWKKNSVSLAFSICVLSLISMRGMMVSLALFLFAVFVTERNLGLKGIIRIMLPFLPGAFLSISYLAYHWLKVGWIGHHEGSAWAPSFEGVNLVGFIKNLAVMVWRMLDFGRIWIWFFVAVALFFARNKITFRWKTIDKKNLGHQILSLIFLIFIATIPIQLCYKGLLAHRYFLPVFVSVNFAVAYYLKTFSQQLPQAARRLAMPLICIGFVTGNLWRYPAGIAMGWDSTLAHLPWYGLQKQAQDYLESQQIPLESVGTAFPNIGKRKYYELNGNELGFVEKDFDENCYIMYSNVMNDFTESEIQALKQTWLPVFDKEIGAVTMTIFKNPKANLSCKN